MKSSSFKPRPVEQVISQHAEAAAMLWQSRNGLVVGPHCTVHDLAKMDGRLEAHLDGLRIAGDAGWKLCAGQLATNEAGEVFAAAILAFESEDKARVAQVLEAGTAESELSDGLISALGWLPFEKASIHVNFLLTSDSSALRQAGLGGCAVHRQQPGDALRKLLRDEDAGVRARALRAVGELGKLDLVQEAESAVVSQDHEVQFWSVWTLALLTGAPNPLTWLRSTAQGVKCRQEEALSLALRRLSLPEAKTWHKQLAQLPEQSRSGVIGAGHLGDPECVPWLIGQMRILSLARRAGEAFTMITGVDLAYRDLERDPPEDFDAGPTENPEDENVAMDPDDNLPWPDPALVQRWWDKNRGQFQNGTRYLLGKPMTVDWLKTVLRDGRQRQRAAAALELAIRSPGQPLFNVKAPGFRQIQILGKPGEPIR